MKKAPSQVPDDKAPKTWSFQPWSLAPLLALLISVLFFSDFKILYKDFVTTGSELLACNLLRVATLLSMAIALYCGGFTTSRYLKLMGWIETLSLSERILVRFFLGAASMTLLMFPLGLLGLYYRSTAFLLAAAFIIPGFQGFRTEAGLFIRNLLSWLRAAGSPRVKVCIRWVFTGCLVLAVLVLLLTRCLYPGETSNDSYEIYWPYQIQTVESHRLAPNDLWYMFCSFNGAGINFWSMLLTDMLGIQSVTFIFLLAGLLATYCISRRVGIGVDWAVGVSLISVQCFPFTNPFWGAFQSHHLQLAAWLATSIWALLAFRGTDEGLKSEAAIATGCILAGIGLVFPLFLIFIIPTLIGLFFLHFFRSEGATAKGILLIATMGTGAALSLMLLNYSVSGMPLSNPTGLMWKLTNQDRYSGWCSPYNMHYLFEGSTERTTGLALGGLFSKPFSFWENLLRLKYYGVMAAPLFLVPVTLLALVSRLLFHGKTNSFYLKTAPLWFPIVTCLLITNTSHPDSVYRNYGFVCFLIPPLIATVLVWALRILPPSTAGSPLASAAFLMLTLTPAVHLFERFQTYAARHLPNRVLDFVHFSLGNISVQEALLRGDGLWTPAQQARNAIGLEKRIYSFCHPPPIASFLFPGTGLLTEPSRYGFRNRWDVVMFGDADTSKAELQRQGIDHFLIDFSQPFFGALAYSPLFDPAKLSERFEVVTAVENSVLLTWKTGPSPMPGAVSNAWYQRVALNRALADPHPDGVMARLYENVRAIHEFNSGKPLPVQRPPNLPKVSGWQ